MSVGHLGADGKDIQDFSLSERDFLDLPLTSKTTNGSGDVTQEVRQGLGPDGQNYMVTTDYTYTGAFVTQAVNTFAGGGHQRTETWTYTRDANGEVTAESVARS